MRYLITILAGVLAAAVIYTAMFVGSLGRTESNNASLTAERYRYKAQLAAQLPSPRIVVVAGSNVLYGIDARRMENTTGISTVNFGTHAALSRDYLLERARKILRPGDTVILALEYELYFPNQVNEVQSDYVLGADAAYFFQMPLNEQIFWAGSASFPKIWGRLKTTEKSRRKLTAKSLVKLKEQLDDRGDYVANEGLKLPPGAAEIVAGLKPLSSIVEANWEDAADGWRDIKKFSTWCNDHGVGVLATFPNTIYFAQYGEGRLAAVSSVMHERYHEIGVATLGTPKDCMFEPADFFDTIYHLNREGAAKRTDRLLDQLQPYLGNIRDGAVRLKR